MPEVAREDDMTECPQDESTGFLSGVADFFGAGGGEHVGGPLENAQPVHLMVDGKPVIRLADHATCEAGPQDTVIEGAATVTVCGLPIARKGDGMEHTGEIIEGSPDFIVGGPSFSLPDVIDIDGPPDFVSDVIRDMYLISTTDSGKELFERLEAAGESIDIQQLHGDNGYASPHDSGDAQNGTPTGTTVSYNPDFIFSAYDDAGDLIATPAPAVLFHEMIHALNNSEGNHAYQVDPSPPASQTGIEEEEAQAIGTGSHDGDYPTENSFREDLELERRDNHFGTWGGADEADPVDVRVGDC